MSTIPDDINTSKMSCRCLGTGQHLKSKFGSGYTLEIKLVSSDEASGSLNIDAGVNEIFPSAVCLERFEERIVYRVDQSDVISLGKAFAQIESGLIADMLV